MNVRSFAAGQILASVSLLALLAGCAATPLGPTVQVMPGPGKSFESFQVDQASCKSYAADQVRGQADAANQRAVGTAVLTTVLTAGLGAAVGGAVGDPGAGAAIGAATGAGGGSLYGANATAEAQYGIQQQYDNAFAQCMYSKGERVPGFAPVASATPYSPAPSAAAVPDPLVRATQSELIRLGYLRDGADGFMGPKTRSALAAFEQANGLPADGAPSQRVLAALQATPNNAPAAATASAPAWVAPVGSAGAAATAVSAPAAPAGWVAPTKSP